MKYFVSADIHSYFVEWMSALHSAGFDMNNNEHCIIVCGDLFDRGDDSAKCLEFAKQLVAKNRFIYVRGNHEDLLNTCVQQMLSGHVSNHHISNGTVKTLADIMDCSIYDVLSRSYSTEQRDLAEALLKFINSNTIDYFELGETVFVHGWVPTTYDENKTMIVHANWREGDWKQARWENGMEMYNFDITVPEKTIVCGHWHTSYGWSKLANVGSEWGHDACFNTFIQPGIVALDGCVAYTCNVNVVIFDGNGKIIN